MRTGRPRKKEVDEDYVCKQYQKGISSKNIARECGVSTASIFFILNKYNIKVRGVGPKQMKLPIPLSQMVEQYSSGKSAGEIAKSLGVKHHMVEKWLRQVGIKFRGMTAFGRVDEHFFDTIDSEKKAYWIGFLCADGNLSKNGMGISITLKGDDKNHLEKFKKDLCLQNVVKIYERKNGIQECYVSFKSRKMWLTLSSLGVVPNKSLVLNVDKIIKNMSASLQRHFWRGMVDGDGSLFKNKGADCLNLVGTKNVCERFKDFIECNVGKTENINDCGSYFRVTTNNFVAKKLMNHLYSGVKVFLDRKKEIADSQGMSEEDGVRAIGQQEAAVFFRNNHYLKTLPVGCICFGFWKNCNLKGVAAFGVPSSCSVQKMIFGEHKKNFVWELRRFALSNDCVKNDASMFLSKALDAFSKLNRAWVVVSYADQGVGHFGIIYQACNAFYFGCTGPELEATLLDGRRLSGVHLKKLSDIRGVSFALSPGKHRYCFVLGNKKEKQERISLLNISFQKYPKAI